MTQTTYVHATARLCPVPMDDALAHLSRQAGMSQWILGLWECREIESGLFTGRSLFDGGMGFVRVDVDALRGVVDYWVGVTPEVLAPRIRASVMAGEVLGYPQGTSLVTLEAWRTPDMDDARWARLVHTHETEIELIRAQLSVAAGS